MDELLSNLLDDYVARRQRGERPSAEEYRLSAGAAYEHLARLLEAEASLDEALEEEGDLPRAFGAYTLVRELGRGASGVVYEARRGSRTVALKVLRPGFDTSPDAITRFRREAEACARIRHDHVVEVYEAGEMEGRPFYAMAFLDGRSLSALARAGKLPEPRELARRLARVADALHAIHQNGVVHRDVKPGNIMADSTGRMVLADFGLARSVGAATLTRTGEALGTPLFMSPEQLLGDRARIDGRTDVYGLGATLYELLSGGPLFTATDWPELVRSILDERPKPLHEIAPGVPLELSRVVMKALEKRPEDRYADAGAMRDDLLAFAEGRSVEGRPVSDAQLKLRGLRRRWKPLAVAAAVLLGAGYLFFTWRATLTVDTYPAAQVILDDESLGMAPLEVRVRPGSHRLVLKSAGFKDYEKTLDLRWGSSASVERILIANPDDPRAQEILARKYGLPAVALAAVPVMRGSGDGNSDKVIPLYPRGDVRAEDLTDLRIDVGPEWEAKGKLEVRAGGTTYFSAPFAPGRLSTVAAVPEAAKAALKPGDEFEWGFYPEKGEPVVARCRVVADSRGTAKMERDLSEQDPSLVALFRAKQFLKEGLFLAAYREASRLADAGKLGRQPLAVMQQALAGMELEETPLERELNESIARAGG